MYETDFTTCTMDDVISRSIICHPSVLIERLRASARIHFTARDEMHDPEAVKIAQRCGMQCREAANIVESLQSSSGEAIERMGFGERLATYSAASRLQLIPPATAQDIARRG